MGNNLDAYRAAIGLFRACKMSLNIGYDSHSDTFHDILITNLRCSFLFASLLILQSLNPKVNVAFILFVFVEDFYQMNRVRYLCFQCCCQDVFQLKQ
jgi:hypothetical protein